MEPPYYAVIFTLALAADASGPKRLAADAAGYGEMAAAMEQLAAVQPGYLGIESARDADGAGITVSYWRDLDAIRDWKRQIDHLGAQRLGRERWYARYRVRIARVEREYGYGA